MKTFTTVEELIACVGQEVSTSDWIKIDQEKINQFATATGDHQWIHTDPIQASQGPFKTTIAHGFLTLSLIPEMLRTALCFPPSSMAINYGLNKVRFTNPVPVNSQLRGHFYLLEVESLKDPQSQVVNGFQMIWKITIEQDGASKPVCIAESVVRRYH